MKSFLSKSGAIAAGLLLATATFSPPIQAATPTPDAVNEEFADATVKAIINGAKTGEIGDGKIFIFDLPECIRIRTEEKGHAAIG